MVPPRGSNRHAHPFRWGSEQDAIELDPQLLQMLRTALGVRARPRREVSAEQIELPDPQLRAEDRRELAGLLGAENVLSDAASRLAHTRGKSTTDLLRMRKGDADGAPDLVLLPCSHAEVLSILELCSERNIALVPYGGGTSVVGGLTAVREGFAGVVALDLMRIDKLVDVDGLSLIATLEPGILAPDAEAQLARRGYTLGHYPQSFERATIGGFAATRSSGQASSGYGRFDELVVALRLATPTGTIELGRAPRSAAGPDLRQLVLGSEGALGVITSVTVEVRPLPERRQYDGWLLKGFSEGIEVLRRIAQDGLSPAVLRLSDEAETAVSLAAQGGRLQASGQGGSHASGQGAMLIVGYEGASAQVSVNRREVSALLEGGGAHLVEGAGDAWLASRFEAPLLRDALLDEGVLVETVETACFWSGIGALHARVGEALRSSLARQGTPPIVLCHISHLYRSGASLYFTVACAELEDPIAQWQEAKAAASDAILAAGGTISHHHGVGADHRAWYAREAGPLAIEALRAVKRTLDPSGTLNPGVLIPTVP